MGFIRSWIYKAEISDPYKEFIVECFDNLPSYRLGNVGMSSDFPLAKIRVMILLKFLTPRTYSFFRLFYI